MKLQLVFLIATATLALGSAIPEVDITVEGGEDDPAAHEEVEVEGDAEDPCRSVRCAQGERCVVRLDTASDPQCLQTRTCPSQVLCHPVSSKKGACPAQVPIYARVECDDPPNPAECSVDDQCLGKMKCCPSVDCGTSVCTIPKVTKKGECPAEVLIASHASCRQFPNNQLIPCEQDHDCPYIQKCCGSGQCGRVCANPLGSLLDEKNFEGDDDDIEVPLVMAAGSVPPLMPPPQGAGPYPAPAGPYPQGAGPYPQGAGPYPHMVPPMMPYPHYPPQGPLGPGPVPPPMAPPVFDNQIPLPPPIQDPAVIQGAAKHQPQPARKQHKDL